MDAGVCSPGDMDASRLSAEGDDCRLQRALDGRLVCLRLKTRERPAVVFQN